MPATAENLRELHALHERLKAIRDRLAAGPKSLAARKAALERKQAELTTARDALKHAKADIKNKEVQAQGIRDRASDLRVKLNTVKKQAEYDALRNEIAFANTNASKVEDEVLEAMQKAESREGELKAMDDEVARLSAEAAALEADIAAKAAAASGQVAEIEAAIAAAEEIIPAEQRDQYRRNIKNRGADSMAPVENGACHGCYVSVTSQMVNDLINGHELVFCKTCGRILYLAEEADNRLRRVAT
jgi:predicted  nucleic acid-binding Zn-ribbon protein